MQKDIRVGKNKVSGREEFVASLSLPRHLRSFNCATIRATLNSTWDIIP